MNPAKKRAQGSVPSPDGALLRLQIQVARRADTLARQAGRASGRDLVHWLQAESEVLGRHFQADEPTGVLLGAER